MVQRYYSIEVWQQNHHPLNYRFSHDEVKKKRWSYLRKLLVVTQNGKTFPKQALFSFEIFLVFGIVVISFLFDKHCPIIK